jgi:hypothetical protein
LIYIVKCDIIKLKKSTVCSKISKQLEIKTKKQINMKNMTTSYGKKRSLLVLAAITLVASSVFSFVPDASAQTPLSKIFNTTKPQVKNAIPIETSVYSISITGTDEVFLSVGNQVVDLSDTETEWPSAFSDAYFYHYEDELGGYSISLPAGQNYDLAFVTGENPIDLSVLKMDESGATVEVVKYCNCSWDTVVAAQIQIKSGHIGDLYYDSDGDGELDTRVAPNVRDENPNGVDLENPEVFVDEQYSKGDLKLFLRARDNEKVDKVLYYFGEPNLSFDKSLPAAPKVDKIGNTNEELVEYIEYKKPIAITSENLGKTIFVIAFDKVGNQSLVVQYTIGSIKPSTQGVATPEWAQENQLVKFSTDPSVYLVSKYETWGYQAGLIPFETKRMLDFVQSSLQAEDMPTIYSDEDPNLYTRFVRPTVEHLISDIVYYCKDYPFANHSLVTDEGTVYLLSGCTKIPFASLEALTGLGYSVKNIQNGDLDLYGVREIAPITSKDSAHPWGSWVNYNGTVYFAHSDGMIPVTSLDIMLANGGRMEDVLPATKGDIEEINLSAKSTPVITEKDYRVLSMSIFGAGPYELKNIKSITERRDEKRYSDTADINWAVYSYYYDHEKYPTDLNELIPDYMESIPQAPLPVDGNCTEAENKYKYQLISEDEFQISYCLGGVVYGSYGPGVQVRSNNYEE